MLRSLMRVSANKTEGRRLGDEIMGGGESWTVNRYIVKSEKTCAPWPIQESRFAIQRLIAPQVAQTIPHGDKTGLEWTNLIP